MFKMGSFGGTYWRPIYSSVTKKNYKNVHKKYPKSWWEGIPEDHLSRPFEEYDANINKFVTVLKSFLHLSQFVIITHSRQTISAADVIYGVTMENRGVSKLVSMQFSDYEDKQ